LLLTELLGLHLSWQEFEVNLDNQEILDSQEMFLRVTLDFFLILIKTYSSCPYILVEIFEPEIPQKVLYF
jgi:hypothetical protein